MPREQDRAARDAACLAGVPLGGIGAGCAEYARDGRFRNITINNNRDSRSRIPVAPGAFVAVRAADRGRVSARVLQANTDAAFTEAGVHAHFTAVEECAWRGLYPRAEFTLQDSGFPLEVTWGGVCPIIPYDTDASTLPGFFVQVTMRNPSKRSLACAALVNWENLAGCTAETWPEERGACHVVTVEERVAAREGPETRVVPAGLEFAAPESPRSNAEGSTCLLAHRAPSMALSFAGWDERDPEALRALWQAFHDTGRLSDTVDQRPQAHSAALAGAFTLEPGERARFLVVLTWHRPRFEVAGRDQGNGYAAMYSSARHSALRALRHHEYLLNAVEAWQRRFMNSSQPRWLNRMLVNSLHVLSTNTLWTHDGRFALFESPEEPRAGIFDLHLDVSLAVLVLFPKLAAVSQTVFMEAGAADGAGTPRHDLGRMCMHDPGEGGGGHPALANAVFIVTVYRDYVMTGVRAQLERAFPVAHRLLLFGLAEDRDGDGLPDPEGERSAHADGMWLAAVRCFAEWARALGRAAEGDWADSLLAAALKAYDRAHWRPGVKSYAPDPAGADLSVADVSGPLAGQWCCDLLAMGSLLDFGRVGSTLDELAGRNPTAGMEWPALAPAHRWAPDVFRGDPARTVAAVQRLYEGVHVRAGRAFSSVACWKPVEGELGCGITDRHVGALAVWHVFTALHGVLLDAARQELWVRRCPEPGEPQVKVPIVTPGGFGQYSARTSVPGTPYQLELRIAFDSPTALRRLIVCVPGGLENARVSADGPEECRIGGCRFGKDGQHALLEITFAALVTVMTPLDVVISQRDAAGPGASS